MSDCLHLHVTYGRQCFMYSKTKTEQNISACQLSYDQVKLDEKQCEFHFCSVCECLRVLKGLALKRYYLYKKETSLHMNGGHAHSISTEQRGVRSGEIWH